LDNQDETAIKERSRGGQLAGGGKTEKHKQLASQPDLLAAVAIAEQTKGQKQCMGCFCLCFM